jgi:hypothetical protein
MKCSDIVKKAVQSEVQPDVKNILCLFTTCYILEIKRSSRRKNHSRERDLGVERELPGIKQKKYIYGFMVFVLCIPTVSHRFLVTLNIKATL